MVGFLDRIPAVARWSADRYLKRIAGRRLPPHIRSARIDRSTGAILFSYDPPVEQGGWLDGWEPCAPGAGIVGMAKILYSDWCVPSRAFHHVVPDRLITLWVLGDEEAGRGLIHVV